jgi:hypothetical protein
LYAQLHGEGVYSIPTLQGLCSQVTLGSRSGISNQVGCSDCQAYVLDNAKIIR